MKKRTILISMLAASLAARAAEPDSVFSRKQVEPTRVSALFSLYMQDGDHSAVTGGEGTERLTVYAAEFGLTHQTPSRHEFRFRLGGDLISSASTDKIDFVMSSASRLDLRTHADVSYTRNLPAVNSSLLVGAGLSSESDYLSVPLVCSFEKRYEEHARKLQAAVRMSFDDLRWGRYTHGLFNPQNLVYPFELRYREWYDTYRRHTYQLSFGFSQKFGERFTLGFYPEWIYQEGLLATPFHRAYFTDGSLRTENLPGKRYRLPLRLRGAAQVSPRTMIRSEYRFYRDNFGIVAHAIQADMSFPLTSRIGLMPVVRIYRQGSADFFRPAGMHDPAADYYTSDYDFSGFQSFKAGLGIRLAPGNQAAHDRSAILRYAWYHRDDGLVAHTLSLVLE